MLKSIGLVLLAAIIGAVGLGLPERTLSRGGYGIVSPAEAVVGRPLTPVSVAGTARRTARRCASGAYEC
jgi:hypothetical protein